MAPSPVGAHARCATFAPPVFPSDDLPALIALVGLGAISVALLAGVAFPTRIRLPGAFRVLWVLFLIVGLTEWVSFTVAIWILALFSFALLREYFSLLDIRVSDRWALLAAYMCVEATFGQLKSRHCGERNE